MDILNTTSFQFASLSGRLGYPKHSLSLVLKGTFSLEQDGKIEPAEEQLFPTGDEKFNDVDGLEGSLYYASDFVCFKPKADLILVGKCHTTGGKYVQASKSTFGVGSYSKSVMIFGDRHWKRNALGIGIMSDPEPFNEMELRYENSFGGPGYKDNPIGKGYSKSESKDGKKTRKLPNIEDPNYLIDSPGSRSEPAGFGAINSQWPLRQLKMGTYKGDYIDKRWPWFPEDFDYTYFNAAPEDMQVHGYLHGDEKLYFENLHKKHSQYSSQLPGVRIRCFVTKQLQPGSKETSFNEVAMNLDTLWVDMEAEKVILVWRGWTEVLSEEYEEVQHIFIMSEQLENKLETKEQYHALFLSALKEYATEETIPSEAVEEPEPIEQQEPPEVQVPEDKPSPETMAADLSKAQLKKNIETMAAALIAQLEISMTSLPPHIQQQVKEHQQKLNDKISEEDPLKFLAMEQEEDKIREELYKIDIDYDNLPPLSEKAKSEQQRLMQEMGDEYKEIVEDEALTKYWQLMAAILPKMGLDPENLDTLIENVLPQLAKIKEQLGLGVSKEEGEETKKQNGQGNIKQCEDNTESVDDDALATEGDDVEADSEDIIIDINQRLTEGKSLDGIDMSGYDFVGQDLTGVDFSGAILAGALLSGVNLEGAILTNADLKKSDLTGTNLAGANLARADLSHANLEKANLEGADLTESNLDGANLKNCLLNDAIFEKAKLNTSNLEEANAIGTAFTEADLTGASCKGSDLASADLSKCLLHNANFTGANLSDTSLEGAQGKNINFSAANLTRLRASEKCDFSGGNFSKCTCEESIWHEANLSGADFSYVKMPGADFSKCNLEKANLSGCEIKSGRFTRANLKSAKMIMSNLFECSLEKADLTNADLSGSNMYAAEFLDAIIAGTNFNGTNLKMTKLARK